KHKPTPELLTMRTPQRSQPFPYTTLFRSRKLDKHTWHAERCQGPLVVRDLVYAWDLSVRGAHLDRTHGYFNGTSVFLRAIGHERSEEHTSALQSRETLVCRLLLAKEDLSC